MNGTKNKSKGKVYICGAGPGNPDLITKRCWDLLKNCDIILYDRLVGREILELIPENTPKIYVGRSSGDPATNQVKTNQVMLQYALEGKKVLRLKGGDPFIFGRGGEEAEFLNENAVDFEIIPGISSAIGSAVYSGIPLTHRQYSSSVAIVTGHEDPTKKERSIQWDKLATAVDTIVILMGVENLESIIKNLINHGLSTDTKIAVIQNGTLKQQKVIIGNFNNIRKKMNDASLKPPAVIIIGDVVSLSDKIKWV
ncbi:MAG TPA: uroporphyrinogen-III C-methyltransferase [Nitrososphaeraceae archaeon]|jgi:uroporphyrin-III C-methyltransferase|nr:uroporphyrinogen-III C-methyltransferase [Nitrososphaeraceae archaeon]